jgi:L-lactate dehydrogenase complex protein LldG
VPERGGTAFAELLRDFAGVLDELAGTLHEAASLDEARARARELIGDATVARWEDPELDGITEARAPALEADVSLIVGEAAIAETAQIALVHRAGRSRAAALLPPRQVVLLRRATVVRTVAQAFALLGLGGPEHPGHVVFVAGPSRTADIEQRMILGVHAPRTLDAIVY